MFVAAVGLGAVIQGGLGIWIHHGVAYASGPNVVVLKPITSGHVQFDTGIVSVVGFTVSKSVFAVTGYFDGVYMVKNSGKITGFGGNTVLPMTRDSWGYTVYYFTSTPKVVTVNGEEYTYVGNMSFVNGEVFKFLSWRASTEGIILSYTFAFLALFVVAIFLFGKKEP